MNIIKKTITYILASFIIASVLMLNVNVKAYSTTYDDTKTGSYTPTEETVEYLNGVEHIKAYGDTTYSGVTSKQQINVFKLKTNGVTSKLVNWAIMDGNAGYKRAQLTKIAQDYEKNHPGWTVIAGINADQYALSFGAGGGNNAYLESTPYYPVIMDSEVRFPYASVAGISSQYVGFTNDGKSDGIVDASPFKCFALYILDDEENEIAEFELNGINQNASSNQTTVWTALASNKSSKQYISKEVNTTNKLFYVENADLAYAHTSREYGEYDVIFAKGSISSTPSSAVVSKGQFAIETTNEDVINALSIGKKIKVQAKFQSDAMNNVETAAGYHAIHRYGGKDSTIPGYSAAQLNSQYDARQYNRSIFGMTEDGTYVLLTADKSNGSVQGTKYQGLRYWEANAVLKHYGVTEAYQQDGGGSVTAIFRNAEGGFDVVNTPSDSASGTQRSIFNGLFFVVRDPGFTVTKDNTTRNSIKITLKETNLFDQMENIKVEINNKSYDMTDKELLIEGLEEDTEYTVNIKYDYVEDNKSTKDSYQMKIKTKAFQMPDPGLEVSVINKESITVIKKDTEYASWIKDVYVHVSGNSYFMGDQNEFTIEDLISETTYNVHFTYNVYEPSTGNIYKGTSEEVRVKTLSVELPQIVKFAIVESTKDTIKVEYQYIDEDDAVTVANIYCGNQTIALNKKRGTITISNLDLTKYEYKITLSLQYKANKENIFQEELKQELMSEKMVVEDVTPPKKGCNKSGALMISSLNAISLLVLVLRKRK